MTGGVAFEGQSGFAKQAGDKGNAECQAGFCDRGISRPKSKTDAQESAILGKMLGGFG